MDDGISPRQRKVYVLRWNPAISSCTYESFVDDLEWFKAGAWVDSERWGNDKALYWNVYDWKSVEYMDLFVMVQVGKGKTGIVGCGYLHSYPLQNEKPDGTLGRTRFFKLSYLFMQDPAKSNILSGEELCSAVPEVDWMHGHSGELLSTENAEKLALFMVKSLKDVDDCEYLKFDDYDQKMYVLNDIMTFMCPQLKKTLLEHGKNTSPEIKDINNLMVSIIDEDYSEWETLEDHLELEELNGIMM